MSTDGGKFVIFNEKIWYINLEKSQYKILLEDDSMRDARVEDGQLMDVLFTGRVIDDPRTNFPKQKED